MAAPFVFAEPHQSPVYAVAFNQCDADQLSVFATVGANCASVYKIEDPEDGTESTTTLAKPGETAARVRRPTGAGKSRAKRQRGAALSFASRIVALQVNLPYP